jgi:hypothetical protein
VLTARERRVTSRRGTIERRAGDRRHADRRHVALRIEREQRRSARRAAGLERRLREERRARTDRRETSRAVGALAVAVASVGRCIRLIRQAEPLDPLLRTELLEELASVAVRINQAILDARAIGPRGSSAGPR